MMKRLFIAPIAALLLAGAARAGELRSLNLQPQVADRGLQDVVEVQTHRSTGAVIAQDALYGGIAGLAIGAGVALLDGGNNWGRDLAVGAGVGLIAGGVFGAVDAAASADRAYPVVDNRDRGFGSAVKPFNGKF